MDLKEEVFFCPVVGHKAHYRSKQVDATNNDQQAEKTAPQKRSLCICPDPTKARKLEKITVKYTEQFKTLKDFEPIATEPLDKCFVQRLTYNSSVASDGLLP